MSKRPANTNDDPFNFEASDAEGTQSDTEQFDVQGDSLVSKRQCLAAFPVPENESPDVIPLDPPGKLDAPTPQHAVKPGAVLLPSLIVHAGDDHRTNVYGDEISGPAGSKWTTLVLPNGKGSQFDHVGVFLKASFVSVDHVCRQLVFCGFWRAVLELVCVCLCTPAAPSRASTC